MSDENNDRPATTPPPLVPPRVRESDTGDQQEALRDPDAHTASVEDHDVAQQRDDGDSPYVEPTPPELDVPDESAPAAAVPFGSDRPVTAEPPAPAGEPASERDAAHDDPAPVPLVEPEPQPQHDSERNGDDDLDRSRFEPAPVAATPVDAEPVAATPVTADEVVVEHPSTAPADVPQPILVPGGQEQVQQQPYQQQQQQYQQRPFTPPPVAPKKKGNRGLGSLIALLSVIVFAALYAAVTAIIVAISAPRQSLGDYLSEFFAQPQFYVPAILFVVGFVIVVLLVNRANWWAFVLGSLFVGALVYFGTIGILLLIGNVFALTPAEANVRFVGLAINPIVIAAGLVAREVSLWMGAAISARGRRMKARNAAARDDYERASAEHRAEYERGYAPAV